MTYLGFQRALRGCLPAVFAAAFLMPGAASAEQAAAESNLWIKECNADRCNTSQGVFLTQDGSQRVIVSVEMRPDKKVGVASFVPLGFIIPAGVIMAIDGEQKAVAQFVQCTPPVQNVPPGCTVLAEVKEDFVTAMRKGNKLALVLTNQSNQQLPIELSLVGFAKAFDGPGLDPVAARAQEAEKSKQFQDAAKAAAQRMIEKQRQQAGN